MTLAAFRPDTKARLIEEGLIAPTLQMILRRTYGALPTAEGYFTGMRPIPRCSTARRLNPARMVSLANAIQADEIPPLVRLSVTRRLRCPARGGLYGQNHQRGALHHAYGHRPDLALLCLAARPGIVSRRHDGPERAGADLPLGTAQGGSAEDHHHALGQRQNCPHLHRLARSLHGGRLGNPPHRHRGDRGQWGALKRPCHPLGGLPAKRNTGLGREPARSGD